MKVQKAERGGSIIGRSRVYGSILFGAGGDLHSETFN